MLRLRLRLGLGFLLISVFFFGCGGGGDSPPIDSPSATLPESITAPGDTTIPVTTPPESDPSPTGTNTNLPPVALASAPSSVEVGDVANLSALASSDPNGDSLSYRWTLVSRPTGSQASVFDANSSEAILTPDVEGEYGLSLFVSDGTTSSTTSVALTALARMPYVAVEITGLEGDVYVSGLNNSGRITGYTVSTATSRGFVTGPNGANAVSLGTLGGSQSSAAQINDAGVLVGWAQDRIVYDMNRAVVFDSPTELRKLVSDTNVGSSAAGINSTGLITGAFLTGSAQGPFATAFVVSADGQNFRALATLGGIGSYARAINSSGQVIGQSNISDGSERPFITDANGFGMRELPMLPGAGGADVYGINDQGRVVGVSYFLGAWYRAFMTGPNGVGVIDLGVGNGAGSFARGINSAGQVVGGIAGGDSDRAFVTDANGASMRDLNSLVRLPAGVLLNAAVGINDLGQILAEGYDPTASPSTRRMRGFLLTPR